MIRLSLAYGAAETYLIGAALICQIDVGGFVLVLYSRQIPTLAELRDFGRQLTHAPCCHRILNPIYEFNPALPDESQNEPILNLDSKTL